MTEISCNTGVNSKTFFQFKSRKNKLTSEKESCKTCIINFATDIETIKNLRGTIEKSKKIKKKIMENGYNKKNSSNGSDAGFCFLLQH